MFALRPLLFKYSGFFTKVLVLIIGTQVGSFALQAEDASSHQSQKITIYDRIGQQFLPSIAQTAQQEIKNNQSKKSNIEIINNKIGNAEKFNIFLCALSEYSPEQLPSPSDVINTTTCSDIELLCGDDPENLSHHLLSCVDHTLTTVGNIQLQKMLFTPLHDIKQLKNRQQIIKELINNEQLFNQVEQLLQNLKETEDELASFWKYQNAALTPLFQGTYFTLPLFSALFNYLHIDSFKSFVKYLNSSSQALEARHLRRLLPGPGMAFISYLLASSLMNSYETGTLPSPWSIMWGINLYSLCKGIKNYHTLTKTIQAKMINIATYINSVKALANVLEKNKKLAHLGCSVEDLKTIGGSDKQAKKLVNFLESSTFKGKASFFSNHGKSLAALNLMKEATAGLINGVAAAGELDAYMSIAKLYKKYQNHSNATYCFVTFEQKSKPHLNIDSFWHPFLDADKAVTNSVELGESQGNNMVITGPNAGGKSTTLKGITTALLLAQSFGIAPARALSMTPFSKINTYLNIADAQGKESLFQAEMRRVAETVNMMESLKKDEFSFIIIDEMFTGTNPSEAEEAAYRVGKVLTHFGNSICILATHFKKLTQLEQETNGFYKNYKVWVTEKTDGTFHCPYKITPGISDQSIALKLLQQQGLTSFTLQKAFGNLNIDSYARDEAIAA